MPRSVMKDGDIASMNRESGSSNCVNGWIVAAAVALVLGCVQEAWAWGPGSHVQFASEILSNLWVLPPAIAALLAKHRRHFIYGNVATDTVLAKKMSRVKQVCHRWDTGFSLLHSAESDAGRAFAYGYLAHLAADTIAHNKFLPRQMAVSRSTVAFGHLYWEVRADAQVAPIHFQTLRRTLQRDYAEPEHLLEAHLRETLLSFRTNRFIFKRMNLLASEAAWRRSVLFWARLSRFGLDADTLASYHQASLGRIVDVLTRGEASSVLNEDPNGNWALAYARAQRKQLRQLSRARLPHMHIIAEAAAGHAIQNMPQWNGQRTHAS